MFCDELKIGVCRNGVLLALFGAISLGPVVCSAQAALPQKQEAVARTPEENSALNILTKAHPDWMVLRKTPEYNQWLNSKSADFRRTFESTWDANVVAKGLTEFKSWRDTTRQKEALLKKAKAGDADAQFRLGTRLPKSFDFDKDGNAIDNEGVKWLKRAAQQGHSGAKLRLAEMAAIGGVPPIGGAQTESGSKTSGFVDFNKPNTGSKNIEGQKPIPNFFDQFDKPGTGGAQTEGSPKTATWDSLTGTPPESGGVHSEPRPPRSLLVATGNIAGSVFLALFCSYILWSVLGKNVKGSAPVATGRRWMNWVVVVTCVAPLTKFFSQLLGGYGMPVAVLTLVVLGTVVWALVAFGLGALWAYFRKRKPNDAAMPVAPMSPSTAGLEGVAPSAVASASQADIGEDRWSHALAEFGGDARRPGLWARAFAEAQGIETVAKANYLRYRAGELEQEHQARVADRQRELAQEEAQRVRELQEEAQAREAQRVLSQAKGNCPNSRCKAVIPLTSQECPMCGALFKGGSRWSIRPLET